MPDNISPICSLLDRAVILFCMLYTLMQGYLFYVVVRLPRKKKRSAPSRQHVSLVIPCKNEKKRLPALFDSLAHLHSTAGFEIIFVDDGSNDGSHELLEHFAARSTRPVRILGNRFDPSCRLTSKQQALERGIDAASFELIALTDADMELHENWLIALCNEMDDSTALVFGHTALSRPDTLFTLLQSLQLEFLFAIAALFHYARIPGSCMGNNMLIRKSAYRACGGQKAVGYSIAEDRALLNLFYRNKHPVGIATPFAPTATTSPHETVAGFLQQIIRWAVGGFSGGKNLLFFGVVFMLHILLSLAALTGILSLPGSLAVLAGFISSWLVIITAFSRNRSMVSPLFYPLLYPMMVVEAGSIAGYFLTGKKLRWKERSI